MESQLDEKTVNEMVSALSARLKHAENLLAGTNFPAVVGITGAVLEESQTLPENSSAVWSLRASALILRGNALREQGTGITRKAALACYDEALRLWDMLPPPEALIFRNLKAKTWMNRGMTLLNEGGAEHLRESIRCFDRAIHIRQELDGAQEPLIGYGLAAGWMNRADALTRLGGEANSNDAVRSFDEALKILAGLPIDTNPLFRQRTAIAWLNRGLALEAFGTGEGVEHALESFDKCIAVLADAPSIPKQEQVVAAAWLNRGNVLLKRRPADFKSAREAALRAVDLVAGSERDALAYAEIGLKARHVACRAIASLTERLPDITARRDAFVETTDLVDEGMDIVRHWHSRGVKDFGTIPGDLFRFGLELYQIYQPHFVEEFMEENKGLGLSPDR